MVDSSFFERNIFLTLERYSQPNSENYLTEAFCFLLRILLEKDCEAGCQLLNKMNPDLKPLFDPRDKVVVCTQESTDYGTPDIKISSHAKVMYVEVKLDSPLSPTQISRYREALASQPEHTKRLVLLTHSVINITDETEKPDKQIRWIEIHDWLSRMRNEVSDDVAKYFMEAFIHYMEVKKMSIQRVSWEYINGVPAMLNLINMMEKAIVDAGLTLYKHYPRSAALNERGFYIQNTNTWCGIRYDNPMEIIFWAFNKDGFDRERIKKPEYPVRYKKDTLDIILDLERYHFFSLSKEEQLKLVTDFAESAHGMLPALMAK
ncbi:MAG: PD-(D/E)XK nuclease family protein [Chloroflexi bacterium]|nr:PD-(D/E)XK nuclease family protein [Chloroflexota bacterium]